MQNNDILLSFIKNYWKYYLRLEDEFISTLNFVEFEKSNFNTYSIKFLNLFLSVCSEIDVVGKFIANHLNNNFKIDSKQNIYYWWYEIENYKNREAEELFKQEVNFYDIEKKTPWKGFEVIQAQNIKQKKYLKCSPNCSIPKWWKDYNKVKHNRTGETNGVPNYKKANLYNLSQAFAGLYVLEHTFIINNLQDDMYYPLITKSKLFEKEKIQLFKFDNDNSSLSISEDYKI